MKITGEIEVTLRDKETGEIVRRGRHKNTVTDIWRMRSAILTASTGSPGIALRGVSKPTTGQYNAPLADNNFGIYALTDEVTIDNVDIIPPYVDASHAALNDKVAFYKVNNEGNEDAMVMEAADPRCVFSYDPSDTAFSVKYVKNSGEAQIKSVMFGRDYATPQALQGYLLGENIPGITGTANYFLEHRIDRTRLWKTSSATAQAWLDLLDKQSNAYTSANLHTNIALATLTGGLVIGNTVCKATRVESTDASVTVRLTGVHDFTTATIVTTKDIVFTGVDLNTARINYPVLVARPDQTAYEVFMAMEVANNKCIIKKATVRDFSGGLDTATVTITDACEIDYLISSEERTANNQYCTGYFDIVKQQYWLPYTQRVGAGNTLISVQTADYQPGVVFDSTFTNVIRHYYARTGNNVNSPVLTNHGVLQCRANTTTYYYFWGSGIIAGANFTEPYTKTQGNILEIIYDFKFN